MVRDDITKIIKEFIKAVSEAGVTVDGVYLFGSYAAGKATEWSDIDLALLLPEIKTDRFDLTLELRKIALKIDPRIEPLVFQTQAFQADDWIPIIHEIKTHGIAVSPAA